MEMNQYTSGRNTNDSTLRFSSNSSVHPFEIDTSLVSLYFDILSTQINPVDLDTPKVYLNGTPCSFKIIPPIITVINNYIKNQEMFKVFPNPTTGMVTIEMPSNTNLQIVTVNGCNVLVADN